MNNRIGEISVETVPEPERIADGNEVIHIHGDPVDWCLYPSQGVNLYWTGDRSILYTIFRSFKNDRCHGRWKG